MLIRYNTDKKGKLVKQAVVYTADEHRIRPQDVDRDAVKVVDKLVRFGYQAYIVGGAVRDLINGRIPKDFDIVTDAHPESVRKIFRNSRIIGRRFRLVHVYFADKILEVATFRSKNSEDHQNDYGTIEEDVLRRDFTINALYYSPSERHVIDYVGGYRDIKHKKLVSVVPLHYTFEEDPVRMIRAVKYSSVSRLRIPFSIRRRIKKQAELLNTVSSSRLTEELFKILQSGCCKNIVKSMETFGLLSTFLPDINCALEGKNKKEFTELFYRDLDKLDKEMRRPENRSKGKMLAWLLNTYLTGMGVFSGKNIVYNEVVEAVKNSIKPMIAPNKDVDNAVRILFKKNNIKTPAKRRYSRRPFRHGGGKYKKSRG